MKITNKAKSYIRGMGIKKVSVLPDAYFKFKGTKDAKLTSAVPDSQIKKLLHHTNSLTNKEILKAEEILQPIREEAATLIVSLSVAEKALKSMPSEVPDVSALIARSNKLLNGKRNSQIALVRKNSSELAAINEFIISVTSSLIQRIEKTRAMCLKKINSYECGLHSGGMSDYKYDIFFSNSSVEMYTKKHEKLDNAIKHIVESNDKGELNNETL